MHTLSDENGEWLWSFVVKCSMQSSPPVVEGTVYVRTEHGYVYGLFTIDH